MEKAFLAFLTSIMTVVIEIDDVRKLRYHVCDDGSLAVWDHASELGHILSYVGEDECAKNNTTIEELADWMKDNGSMSRPKVPAHF